MPLLTTGYVFATSLLFPALLILGCGSGGDTAKSAQTIADSLTLTPAANTLTIYPGSTQTLDMAVSGAGTAPVSMTVAGLPTGVTVTSSPSTVLPGGSVTLTFSASVNADAAAFPATDPANANSASTSTTISAVAGTASATAPLTMVVSLSNTAFAPAAGQINLPIVNINTGNVPIVNTTTDVPGTISITSDDGSTTYLPGGSDTDNTATFHVHGHTTSVMPKLPYEMKLGTSVDLLNLLGVKCGYVTSAGKATCDKSKTYLPLANYDDKSLLRLGGFLLSQCHTVWRRDQWIS